MIRPPGGRLAVGGAESVTEFAKARSVLAVGLLAGSGAAFVTVAAGWSTRTGEGGQGIKND